MHGVSLRMVYVARREKGILGFPAVRASASNPPFLLAVGVLNDGKIHNFTLKVVGDNVKGVWSVDALCRA